MSLSANILDIEFPPDPTRPGAGNSGNWFCHGTDMLWIAAQGGSGAEVVAHELSHFFLHCGTPYGLFLDQLNHLRRHLLTSYCTAVTGQLRQPLRYPLYEFARQFGRGTAGKDDPEAALHQELIQTYICPWTRSVFVENTLEGASLPSVRNGKEGPVIRALESVEKKMWELAGAWGNQRADSPPLPIQPGILKLMPEAANVPNVPEISPFNSCPPLNIRSVGHSSVLGARALFEAHAFVSQKEYDAMLIQKLLKTDSSLNYLGVYLAAMTKYGPDKLRTERDRKRLLRTIAALCDLALFTPIGPLFGKLRGPGSDWTAVHPGYRFVESLNAVVRKEAWLESNEQEEYRALQEEICRELRWPEPRQFVELGATLRDPNFCRFQKACEIRGTFPNPFPYWEGNNEELESALKDLLTVDAPLIYAPTARQFTLIEHSNTEAALGKVVTYFLETFYWKLMTSSRVDLMECLPQNVSYENFCDNIRSDQEMLATILEALPFLRAENLAPLN